MYDILIASNIFLSYDWITNTYEVHPLLRNYLMSMLAGMNTTEQNEIYNRIGLWYDSKKDYTSAMHFFFLANNFDALLVTLTDMGKIGDNYEPRKDFISYFNNCPHGILLKYPQALLQFIMRFYYFEEKKLANLAQSILFETIESSNFPEAVRNELLCKNELCEVLGVFNESAEMKKHFSAALSYSSGFSKTKSIDMFSVK